MAKPIITPGLLWPSLNNYEITFAQESCKSNPVYIFGYGGMIWVLLFKTRGIIKACIFYPDLIPFGRLTLA